MFSIISVMIEANLVTCLGLTERIKCQNQILECTHSISLGRMTGNDLILSVIIHAKFHTTENK